MVLVVGEVLCHRLSSLGANLILSGLPNEMDRLETIRDSLEKPQNVRYMWCLEFPVLNYKEICITLVVFANP